jgi:ATP-dependent RNA helicase RhlE
MLRNMSFRTLQLDAAVLKAIAEAGYLEPTPIQAAAIPPILEGRDVIGIAQTGTGKTAAFVLPLLSKIAATLQPGTRPRTRVLIVAPTRELVVQIEENVRAYARYLDVTIAKIYGGVSERPQIKALSEQATILIATPGRLLDIIRGREKSFATIDYLVLDEADRMLDMGFIPAIRQIVKLLPRERQTLFFSATLSRDIEKLTREFLKDPTTIEIGRRSNPAETVTQSIYEISHHLKLPLLTHLLQERELNMVLLFTRTKHGADRIAKHLERSGVTTAALHSNRSQNQRLRALQDFKEGRVRLLVATDIAARGIDVDGISHVINYDFPPHHEDYVHRIGRTGRAQAIGEAISFVTSEDQAALRALERFIGRSMVRKRAEGFDMSAKAPPREPQDRERSSRGGSRFRTDRARGETPRHANEQRSQEGPSRGRAPQPSATETPKKPGRRRFMGFGRHRG